MYRSVVIMHMRMLGCTDTRAAARPAIIVTDLGATGQRQREVRMHIALTRALDVVRVVAGAEAVGEDPVLAGLGS
jgi:hypothetical protein